MIVFDDSYEHDVWNHSNEERIVLLINFWHPNITPEKKQDILFKLENGGLDANV